MRMSQLFGHTLKEAPAEAELASHKLALRAGLVRPLAAGLYTYLPLGWRVIQKIAAILREEMNALGAQEMLMPVLQPADVWAATGRLQSVGPALMRLRDRNEREMVLAMTHEEAVTALTQTEIESYRDLPRLIYHVQTKLRDEPRPRGGLLRVREFLMKDAYSLHADSADLDAFYPRMVEAYRNVFRRCELPILEIEADVGMMGGTGSHEFMALHPQGEDTIIHCGTCGYAANVEAAVFDEQLHDEASVPREPMYPVPVKVATPDCTTIASVAAFVGVPTSETMKAVFYMATKGGQEDLVFAVIRGDLEVNEVKLMNAVGVDALRPATDDEIRAAGAVPGYASPVGLPVRHGDTPGILVIADDSAAIRGDFVAGANEEGYHLVGVHYGRDFVATVVTDIALATAGQRCARCGNALSAERGIELGHCFKLGTRYSAPTNTTYSDANGQTQLLVMGSYGIGLGRLMATIIEFHHDEQGIVWPRAVAPAQVHLVSLGREGEVQRAAEELYADLLKQGVEVLYDDRDVSPGVKFADADLIGMPLRLTVSRRALEAGGVEAKWRWEAEKRVVALYQVASLLRQTAIL
jgi:prolyl-tRNA synthetase